MTLIGRLAGGGVLALALLLMLVACARSGASTPAETAAAPRHLRLATTTSTADTGLLRALLPDFEQRYNAKVDVIAVGTGQALKLGEQGDADVVLVHARAREDAFVASGAGVNRRDVMYNDFVLVGPAADPLGLRQKASVGDALRAIADARAPFLSRGDDSGTYTKERALWASAGISPTAGLGWYKPLGQGMGETLIATHEQRGYTLSDRGTFLSMRARLPESAVLVGGATIKDNTDAALRNPYGVIPVNPAKHPGIAADLAEQFAQWLVAPETQRAIGEFGKEKYGQPLFYPAAGEQAP